MALGDSIAVDGVCLTVEQMLPGGFIASVSPETLARSTLADCLDGARVNLEASLRVGSKIGGHFVTGHVDGKGYLESSVEVNHAWEMRFQVADPRISRYIVPKGSIAVNGVSLTVADCSDQGDWFTVAVIPVTYADTNLQSLAPGQAVNLEGDVLGKYVERFFRLDHGTGANPMKDWSVAASEPASMGDFSLDFLTEHGYL